MKGRFEGWYYKHQMNFSAASSGVSLKPGQLTSTTKSVDLSCLSGFPRQLTNTDKPVDLSCLNGFPRQLTSTTKSLAVIPGRSADSAFVLVITDDKSYHISYPISAYRMATPPRSQRHGAIFGRGGHKNDNLLHVGSNTFSSAGIVLDIKRPELTLVGEIMYTNLTPICSDIMGPFRFFPMECSHGVISMNHSLQGEVTLNGQQLDFTGGKGYIESDRGRSFPKGYTWVHCNAFDADCSIMASVARIPFYGLRFWGCICVVWLNGKEYRLATYNGVKIQRCKRGIIELKQGKYKLHIDICGRAGQLLPAPDLGKMSRLIRETLSCPARFKFMEGDMCLLDAKSDYVSYEYMMENRGALPHTPQTFEKV